ncbi:MAG: acyl-CoA dehydrogenase family protein [Deltaproteobacteria bacterium]|nr:acyl-CoA dehydrogenase family protein [Deltaproteobacteria bacterium]MBW2009495.1 acyl-CoA dehydrogenase family protein [Deltaproteobacteria bacterium]MBW2348166.1 acyl-CoA dehydrogenase family protein [Deltaproteobacteria bacterium]RLB38969.1 MAG: acyl-CoA dehydrogenase [Deltaproteobacteria bacterium]
MDFQFSEREEMLRKAVREFAENEIPPRMEAMEETGEFPLDLLKPMAQVGITGVITPPEYGGVGMGYVARTIVLEELGRVCAAFPMAMQVHHMGCAILNDFGTDAQKKKYLTRLAAGETMGTVGVTDPAGGSDVMGMKMTAELKGDKYILNGRKCFITNSHTSDFWIVIARTAEGPKGLSAFIVDKDTPGAKPGRKENKVGLRGANTGEWAFDNCEVPKENLLGQEGGGLSAAMKTISETGRSGMAATALGILTAAYEEAGKFASERVLYGKPISALQAIQFHMAELYTQLEICRLLCYRASWMKDQNMRCDTEMAMAKFYTCDAAVNAAKRAIEIHGSYGIMKEYAVQRLLRDAMVTVPAGGTAEIARIVIGRTALAPFKK